MLHELIESWKNMIHNEEVDKSVDENPGGDVSSGHRI